MRTEEAVARDCATDVRRPSGQWNECAPVTVKVPAGKQYEVTVWSSFNATSPSNTTVTYCSGATTPGPLGQICTGMPSTISLAANKAESASDSGRLGGIPAGTYTFSTLIAPGAEISAGPATDFSDVGHVTTTVLVRDVSAPGSSID